MRSMLTTTLSTLDQHHARIRVQELKRIDHENITPLIRVTKANQH